MVYKINIAKTKTIGELQKEFNTIFPFLKIEFFIDPHVMGKGSAKNKMINNATQIGDIQKIKDVHTIALESNFSVSNLEQKFESELGLYIQVFRKSGNVWLETSATDSWTLAEQNEEGEMLAKAFRQERENFDDHDVY